MQLLQQMSAWAKKFPGILLAFLYTNYTFYTSLKQLSAKCHVPVSHGRLYNFDFFLEILQLKIFTDPENDILTRHRAFFAFEEKKVKLKSITQLYGMYASYPSTSVT